jgi:serine/threonine protein kinase
LGGEGAVPREDKTLKLGQIALDRGLISAEQLYDAIEEQTRRAAGGAPSSLPQILLEKGYIKDHQVGLLSEERKPAALGKYTLVHELGRGGMGIVYEAVDEELGRKVALKTLLLSPNADARESQAEVDRFLREAKLTAKLPKHPNIVSVYEAGIIEGKRYLAMELIEGRSFGKWRKAGSPPLRRQVEILRDVALAVHHAHQQGVVHRDLKPDNILLDGQEQPHVSDFGLAKSVGQDVSLSLTATGTVIGTPSYMSPEQALGLKSGDHRIDIYAMGVMLYEILTGQQPFTGETAIEILLKASKNPVPPPSSILKAGLGIDKTLERICLKCLAKKADDRYPTAEAFAADLSRWLKGDSVHVVLPPPTEEVSIRKSPVWIPAVAGLGLLLAIGVGLLFKSQLDQARGEAARAVQVVPTPPAGEFARGLVAHWRLRDGSLSDSSGKGRTAKAIDGARWINGVLQFDGVNGHVEIADGADLDKLRGGSWTVSLWYRPDERPVHEDSGHRLLTWSWGGVSYLDSDEFMIQVRPPGRALVGVSSGLKAGGPGQWHHIAGVVDFPTESVIPYLDGRTVRKGGFNTRPAGDPSDHPWRIGIHNPGSSEWRWAAKGAIDSVRVYDRALGAGEIERLHASEAPAHGQ